LGQSNLIIKNRIIVLFVFLVALLIAIFARLFFIQVGQTGALGQMASDQRLRMLQLEPKRGLIYDRMGRELAISAGAETVIAFPPEIENPEQTARELAGVLNFSYNEILRRITQPRAAIYLERMIDQERAQTIRNWNLPGISFIEESKRFYPQGELASQIIGFAGIDNHGLEGIEVSMDHYLQGQPGRMSTERDGLGQDIPHGIERFIPPKDGHDVFLTIDQVIQYIAERELENALEQNEAKGGSVIVLDPGRGEILAMANQPTFDPNNFQAYPSSSWRNAAITNSFEPGSTFKIITMASALDEGVVNLEDIFFDPGRIRVGPETISCWRDGGHGVLNFIEVVESSCNPGFVQIGNRLGLDNFYKYIQAFNFGNRLGIDLPGEARGLVYDYSDLGPVEMATMTFGHGIAVTPLQMAMATGAIANGGFLLEPRIVKEVRDEEGKLVESFGPKVLRQVVSEETADLTLALLASVVDSGTGARAQIPGYEIGGKTGTAKHYGKEAYDSSFVGVIPIDNPQLVILVVLYEVTSYPYYAGEIAAPVFREIAQDAIRYLEIRPTITEDIPQVEIKTQKATVPDIKGLSPERAMEKLREMGFNVKFEGMGELVTEQVPKPGTSLARGSTVVLFFQDTLNRMESYYTFVPNLRGYTRERVESILGSLGFKASFSGSGTAHSQDPQAGSFKPQGEEIKVQLR